MTLLEAIRPRFPEIVAITGAGGKTTIMLQLAREAHAAGLRVLVTVTTKMMPPDPAEFGPVVFSAAELEGKRLAAYAAGAEEGSGKLLGIDPSAIPGGFELVLVEADGAKHKPLTAPEAYEPVIPPSATTVLAVAGLDAMDQTIGDMHRPEIIARLTGQPPSAPVTPEVVATVLSHPEGNTKGRPEGAEVWYVLNKTDDELRLQQAKQTAALLPPGRALVTVEGFVVWPEA
ncbi:MAG TPA: selenium cofactor biosynthesis protein YqeC [Chloroflexota bacterium]|nr:selenium cofactor biosynthesis protein YqeC [Chloroflexota bacterium]